MVGAEQARKAIESMYDGECTVYEHKKEKDEQTKMMMPEQDVVVLDSEPCRVSFNSLNTVVVQDDANKVSQTIKLFIAPEVEIKAGSKIVVTQNGKTTEYQKSGEAALYETHQEIPLELFKKWA